MIHDVVNDIVNDFFGHIPKSLLIQAEENEYNILEMSYRVINDTVVAMHAVVVNKMRFAFYEIRMMSYQASIETG